jgi:DNA-binding GntR family transcriptional regulator
MAEHPVPNATQRIVDALTTAIVERRLMPGTKLVEQQLADLFKVSRTLVRQALNQLSRDHLVRLLPARGAFVAEPSLDEARQVFELRQMLELQLVKQLCASSTPAQVAQMRKHLQLEAKALRQDDVAGRTRLLADFHVLLARLAGNEVLAQLLADLLARCSLIALMYQSTHSAKHSAQEHVALVDAIEAGDARRAKQLMAEHLGHVEAALQSPPPRRDLATALSATA